MANIYKISFDDSIVIYEKRDVCKDRIFEMHWHDYIEIEILLSGRAEHICNSQITNVERGSAYIITPHDYHAFHALSDITLLNICFDINILDNEIKDALSYVSGKNIFCTLNDERLKAAKETLDIISKEQKERLPFANALSKSLLSSLVIDIIRLSDDNLEKVQTSLAARAVSYVHTHFKEQITLQEPANSLSVSPNYLGKIFKEHTGVSFNDYLNDIRLKYACNMLLFSGLKTAEIALIAGYSSVEYFFYVFKKSMGITPKEYRNKNKL